MGLQSSRRRASVGALVVLVVAMVVLVPRGVAQAGRTSGWEGVELTSLGLWAGATVIPAEASLPAEVSVAARDDGAADAVEVPEPGVPILLIGLGILGVVLAASHRIRAEAVPRHAFDEWEIPNEPREGTP